MAISEAQRNRIKEQLRNRRKTREFKAPKFPEMEEMGLTKAILREVKKLKDITNDVLIPELERLTEHKGERFDIQFKDLAGVALTAALVAMMKSRFYGESIDPNTEPRQTLFTSAIRRMVSPFLNRVKEKTEAQFVQEYERQTGTKPLPRQLDVDEFVKDSLQANVSLIKTIPSQYFDRIKTLTEQAVRQGKLSRDLRNEVEELTKSTRNRAKLIARDQIGKLVGNIEEARQRKIGVTHYIWRTKRDGRVRSFSNSDGYSDHKRLEGTIQKWSDPPITVFRGKRAGERNHPQQDIQCRCWPQPVYDEITGIPHKDTTEARKKQAA